MRLQSRRLCSRAPEKMRVIEGPWGGHAKYLLHRACLVASSYYERERNHNIVQLFPPSDPSPVSDGLTGRYSSFGVAAYADRPRWMVACGNLEKGNNAGRRLSRLVPISVRRSPGPRLSGNSGRSPPATRRRLVALDRLKRNLGFELSRKPSLSLHGGSSSASANPP